MAKSPKKKTPNSTRRKPVKARSPLTGPGGGTVSAAERLIKQVHVGGGAWADTVVPDPPQPGLDATLKRKGGSGEIFWAN